MSNQSNVLKGVLSGGTVSFHAIFAKAFRSIPVGVFLSQGYFWQENAKYRDKEKYKMVEGKTFFTMTAKEWFDETSLTQEQQTRVRETLTKHKVLIEWLTDNPARLFFHIDLEALVSVINQYLVSGVSVSVDNRNKNRFKTQPSLGKKRKQDSVKNLTSYNEESNESLESEREVNTPPPAENFNDLKAEIPPPPKVAAKGSAPSEAAAPLEEEDAFAEWLPSLHKAWDKNAPGAMPKPTHIVKTTGPENPGMIEAEGITLPEIPCNPIDVPLTRDQCPMPRNSAALKESIRNYLVANANEWQHGILDATGAAKWDDERIGLCIDKFCESQEENGNLLASFGEYMELLKSWFTKEAKPKRAHIQTRVETPDEAASQIFDWVNGDGDGTVKNWYSQAYRKYTESDVNALVVRFCGVFLSHKEASIREQMELDPLKFFKKRFQLFVVDQKAHDRNTNTTYAPTNQKANLNRLGSDAAAYREKPLF